MENGNANANKGGGNMDTHSEANHEADRAQPARLHLVKNRLWQERFSDEQADQLIAIALQEMRDGYWLTFPVLKHAGGVCMGVALVAQNDHRTQALDIEVTPGATHVALFLLFNDEAAWLTQTGKLTCLWPEQPDERSEGILVQYS